ncbi:lipase 3 [Camponotus floridanus]|uniref:lipase 3 n=1 Tax=Camponotus floridanus TaxID=104421 RepID=UPI000DC6A00E|nr:lipase 3 [Camponotus floridanus]
MKLIGLICMYLLLFCSHLSADPINEDDEISLLIEKVWTNWNQSNIEINPDTTLDTPEMIKKAGYPAEAHVIQTEDGYLLTLHRIPGGNNSLPVLLQHGLLVSSFDWVILGKNKALAYLLADEGYDVWLGNFRGNTYSKAHISLTPSDYEFWDFSFNELGLYDLPAMITFITKMRSQPLHTYVGHSMGTTSFFVMASERPDVAEKVQKMVALAPAAFTHHMKSPVRFLSPFIGAIELPNRLLFHGEFFQSDVLRFFGSSIYSDNIIVKFLFSNLMFILVGFDPKQFSYSLVPEFLSHYPAGTSTKTILHFVQVYRSDIFRKYDYGFLKNLWVYKSTKPPNYDLSKITVPIALFYADNDLLINIQDVIKLHNLLPKVMDMYRVSWDKFNHVDYMWAKDARKLVYNHILEIMKENPNDTYSNNLI